MFPWSWVSSCLRSLFYPYDYILCNDNNNIGVASGMPCKPEWLPLLKQELDEKTQWQVIAIGREDSTWPTLRKAAELGGHVRTGTTHK